jgi:hypothetical protein
VLEITVGEHQHCEERYAGAFLGVEMQAFVDAAHFVSAGVVSFPHGLNNTPKIAAMLLTVQALDVRRGTLAVAVAMVIGGWLNARKVADTMSRRITPLNHGQGFTANLSTAVLVMLASFYGLPVSITHVSAGSLFGIGLTARTANAPVMRAIMLSWLLTFPCGAVLGGVLTNNSIASNPGLAADARRKRFGLSERSARGGSRQAPRGPCAVAVSTVLRVMTRPRSCRCRQRGVVWNAAPPPQALTN